MKTDHYLVYNPEDIFDGRVQANIIDATSENDAALRFAELEKPTFDNPKNKCSLAVVNLNQVQLVKLEGQTQYRVVN